MAVATVIFREVIVATMTLSDSVLAAFGEIGGGYAEASFGLRRLTPNWLWLKGREWDKHKFEKPIA